MKDAADSGLGKPRGLASAVFAAIRDARVQKANQIALIVVLAMQLGRSTVYFSRTRAAWTALTFNLVGLVLMLFILLREIWRPNTRIDAD